MRNFRVFQMCLHFVLLIFWIHCGLARNTCKITNKTADCSHLKLMQIPSDLPVNITALDISHNQLKTLPPTNFTKYGQLVYLDAGSNIISKLQLELCQNLPLLEVLKLQHNQLRLLHDVFAYCTHLQELNLGFNIIVTENEPFKKLNNLKILDISHNHLISAKLGSQQQLENLQELLMSKNKIADLKKEDLYFLSNSTLKTLDLSSNPITEFHPGCFRVIGALHSLIMNNIQLGPDRTKKLCLELSGTSIWNLSLNQVQLSQIFNSTFSGMNKTKLAFLDISNNSLSAIENDSFAWFPNLESLNLENNKITHLFSHSLSGLYNVSYLNLKNSGIKKVSDLAFQFLKHLKVLIMNDNSFPEIASNTFTGLDSLKNLSLSNCIITSGTITNRTFSSLANSPLQFLNLTRTKTTFIYAGAFSWLRQLKTLDLGLNNIKNTLTGLEFKGLHNIETLYLSYNSQMSLSSDSFIFIPSVRKLMLRRISCSNLAFVPSPFRMLKNLTVLDISNNDIVNIYGDLLNGLHKLEILEMQHNNLARFWKHAIPGGPLLFLKDLPRLYLLNLESNGFDEIPDQAFQRLSQLRILKLGSNYLNLFPEFVFDDLTSLNSLSLQRNLITAIEEKVFGKLFKNLKELFLEFNSFDCTCDSIAWFVDWLNVSKTSMPHKNNYICNTPPKSHGDLVVHFDTSACDSAPFKVVYIVTTTVTLLLITLVLFLHFEGWRIKFFWNVSINRVLGFKEIDRLQQQFDYDAYIIHAVKDKNWVTKNFIPLEENNEPVIKFCLEERDFEAGVSEFEAIVDSINRSRKIIFVVTEHLLKDAWCKRFKVYHAIQQAIEQSRDSIILVFLHDIPDYKLNSALCLRRGMFKSHCILEWPAQKNRIAAFYQQLKLALKSSSRIL